MFSAVRAGGQIYIMIFIFITFKQISENISNIGKVGDNCVQCRQSWRANICNDFDFHNFQTNIF